jgi:hypothetical protein
MGVECSRTGRIGVDVLDDIAADQKMRGPVHLIAEL